MVHQRVLLVSLVCVVSMLDSVSGIDITIDDDWCGGSTSAELTTSWTILRGYTSTSTFTFVPTKPGWYVFSACEAGTWEMQVPSLLSDDNYGYIDSDVVDEDSCGPEGEGFIRRIYFHNTTAKLRFDAGAFRNVKLIQLGLVCPEPAICNSEVSTTLAGSYTLKPPYTGEYTVHDCASNINTWLHATLERDVEKLMLEDEARAIARNLGLQLGGCGFAFADGKSVDGLYAYKGGSCDGMAFFGRGTSAEDQNAIIPYDQSQTQFGTRYRPHMVTNAVDANNCGVTTGQSEDITLTSVQVLHVLVTPNLDDAPVDERATATIVTTFTCPSPTNAPTNAPTSPTASPLSSKPTAFPTTDPPTVFPTISPTLFPTKTSPTPSPSSSKPTASPITSAPTVSPTASPTLTPTTASPTATPSSSAPSPSTSSPTILPTSAPTSSTTLSPSASPVVQLASTQRDEVEDKWIGVIVAGLLFACCIIVCIVWGVRQYFREKGQRATITDGHPQTYDNMTFNSTLALRRTHQQQENDHPSSASSIAPSMYDTVKNPNQFTPNLGDYLVTTNLADNTHVDLANTTHVKLDSGQCDVLSSDLQVYQAIPNLGDKHDHMVSTNVNLANDTHFELDSGQYDMLSLDRLMENDSEPHAVNDYCASISIRDNTAKGNVNTNTPLYLTPATLNPAYVSLDEHEHIINQPTYEHVA